MTLVVSAVGKSTKGMQQTCVPGTSFYGIVGPMGIPARSRERKKSFASAAALGVAPIYPQARGFKENGAYVIGVLGFRNKGLVFWADKFRECCRRVDPVHR